MAFSTIHKVDRVRHLSKKVNLTPANIIVGSTESTTNQAITILQQDLCLDGGCLQCITCTQITNTRQHHALFWLSPERRYTKDHITEIRRHVSFERTSRDDFYIILQHAERLSPVCCNALLKLLEEPPPRYHFYLLTTKLKPLLATLRSRCNILYLNAESDVDHEELIEFMTHKKPCTPHQFARFLTEQTPPNQDASSILASISTAWAEQHQNALRHNQYDHAQQIKKILTIINQHTLLLPMPGSDKLFWRNLFLQINQKNIF